MTEICCPSVRGGLQGSRQRICGEDKAVSSVKFSASRVAWLREKRKKKKKKAPFDRAGEQAPVARCEAPLWFEVLDNDNLFRDG